VRLALSRPLVGRLRLEARRPRCARGHGDARARRPVPALRLPEDSHLPGPRRAYDEAERAYRLWRQAGLQVPKRRPRRRVATSRPRPVPATGPNQVWAYDFVFDACADGRALQCLTVVDEFTRECLAIDVAGSIRSARVIEALAQLVSVHGAPRYLRSDNGPEFVATAILRWAQAANIEPAFIDPGKPWQNGTDESFNGSCGTNA
jgi:putative transposase